MRKVEAKGIGQGRRWTSGAPGALALAALALAAAPAAARTGDSLAVLALDPEHGDVRGLAWGDDGLLYGLDHPGADRAARVFVYARRLGPERLERVERRTAPADFTAPAVLPVEARGLAFAREHGRRVLYFAAWRAGDATGFARLWRWDLDLDRTGHVDLRQAAFDLGGGEVTGVAYADGHADVAFDAGAYADATLRVRRGVLRLRVGSTGEGGGAAWIALQTGAVTAASGLVAGAATGGQATPRALEATARTAVVGGPRTVSAAAGRPGLVASGPLSSVWGAGAVRHLPGSGSGKSMGLVRAALGGAGYLFGTASGDRVVCADAASGRALFAFPVPRHLPRDRDAWGLAFDGTDLWTTERISGADYVHRVDVARDPTAPDLGARRVRRLRMSITTTPSSGGLDLGWVRHNYSHPYADHQTINQGLDPCSRVVRDLTGRGEEVLTSSDPAGDPAARQWFSRVVYDEVPSLAATSTFEVDVWTRRGRHLVYPHLASRDAAALAGTDYLADDDVLFNLSDRATYEAFVARVARWVEATWGVPADLTNPYWAARNVLEYIQEHYHYPHDEIGRFATEDPARGHFNANPANLKLALSAGPYDQDEIIACSGTSVMVAGVMRHLGIPARWVGTSQQKNDWDQDGDGLLGAHEEAVGNNGHRYTEVWLGPAWGWQRFDATPYMPAEDAYDAPPAALAQTRFMDRAACGVEENRLVLNVGSGKVAAMFRIHEGGGPIDRDAGDQRYNLQGRFERPELWNGSGHSIRFLQACGLEVTLGEHGFVAVPRDVVPTAVRSLTDARAAATAVAAASRTSAGDDAPGGALVATAGAARTVVAAPVAARQAATPVASSGVRATVTATAPGAAPAGVATVVARGWGVRWTRTGRWDLDPEATVSVLLERTDAAGAVVETVLVAAGVPAAQGFVAVGVDALAPGTWRALVLKDGDAETGARSATIRR